MARRTKQTRASYLLGNLESAKSENLFCRDGPYQRFSRCAARLCEGSLWRANDCSKDLVVVHGTCSGFFPELNGNDFEIDLIMCGVCISLWRFGNANGERP